jgi:hypothetical protein
MTEIVPNYRGFRRNAEIGLLIKKNEMPPNLAV